MAALAVIVGGVNFYDWAIYRRTSAYDRFVLKVARLRPHENKSREIYFYVNLILGGGILGFIYALTQSGARGQIFLPAIAEILRLPHLRVQAGFFLGLYNLMFVLPMGISLSMLLSVLKSPRLVENIKRRISMIKIISSALFLGFGTGLLLTLRY